MSELMNGRRAECFSLNLTEVIKVLKVIKSDKSDKSDKSNKSDKSDKSEVELRLNLLLCLSSRSSWSSP